MRLALVIEDARGDQYLLIGIGIPPESDGTDSANRFAADAFSAGGVEPALAAVFLRCIKLDSRMSGDNVSGHALAMHMRRRAVVSPDDFAGFCVRHADSVFFLALFLSVIDFKTRTRRVMIVHIEAIGMAQACGPHRRAVVVQAGRTEDDFVASVAVHIGGLDFMPSLAAVGFPFAFGSPFPNRLQVLVERPDFDQRIGAAVDQDGWRIPVQVGKREKIAAIPIVILEAFAAGPIGLGHNLACRAIEFQQPFRPGLNQAFLVARIAFAGLAIDFGFAVAVDVIGHHGGVPCALFNRPAHIVPPQHRAVHLVGFELVSVFAFLPVAFLLVWIDIEIGLLDQNLELAVSVQIGRGRAANLVRALHGNGYVRFVSGLDNWRIVRRLSNCGDSVLSPGGGSFVEIIRGIRDRREIRFFKDLVARQFAVHIERRVCIAF
ncbi:MAG: hypothetical protein BWZ10_01985 [candidate division BRC1 bacterium ADurb.BinA364]|nr:MAG: hypothetical protein BWZ10_01985 [candidate division BRC1 bacterium ADurb.BinA364]